MNKQKCVLCEERRFHVNGKHVWVNDYRKPWYIWLVHIGLGAAIYTVTWAFTQDFTVSFIMVLLSVSIKELFDFEAVGEPLKSIFLDMGQWLAGGLAAAAFLYAFG